MIVYRIVTQTIFIVFASLILTSAVNASECKELSATGNSEYPPYLWQPNTKSKHLTGAISVIIAELGSRLNRNISLKHVGTWSRAQEEVKSGRVDIMAGAFYTQPRSQWMDYVYPAFLSTNSVVWQHKDAILNYHNKQSLMGKLGVTVINNSFGQEFDDFAKNNLDIEFVASLEQAFKMLQLKRVNYVLYEENPGLSYANQMGVAKDIIHLSPPISSEGLYLTISHKSKCNTGELRGALAKVIGEMAEDGFMNEALKIGLALRKHK